MSGDCPAPVSGTPIKDHARLGAELRELTGIHELLLEEVLRNADEDFHGADEAPEYIAEHYVRWLESERDRLTARCDQVQADLTEAQARSGRYQAENAHLREVLRQADAVIDTQALSSAGDEIGRLECTQHDLGEQLAGLGGERDAARATILEICRHIRDEGYLALMDLVPGWLERADVDYEAFDPGDGR